MADQSEGNSDDRRLEEAAGDALQGLGAGHQYKARLNDEDERPDRDHGDADRDQYSLRLHGVEKLAVPASPKSDDVALTLLGQSPSGAAARSRRRARPEASAPLHGERRTNETHASTTDSDARRYRKGVGKEARRVHMGHLLMENHLGLVVACLTRASGRAEQEAAISLVEAVAGRHRITLGADRGYDTRDFTTELRGLNVTPRVAQNTRGRRFSLVGGAD
jgi:hypothetical protein